MASWDISNYRNTMSAASRPTAHLNNLLIADSQESSDPAII